jgi:hypothetical protein
VLVRRGKHGIEEMRGFYCYSRIKTCIGMNTYLYHSFVMHLEAMYWKEGWDERMERVAVIIS